MNIINYCLLISSYDKLKRQIQRDYDYIKKRRFSTRNNNNERLFNFTKKHTKIRKTVIYAGVGFEGFFIKYSMNADYVIEPFFKYWEKYAPKHYNKIKDNRCLSKWPSSIFKRPASVVVAFPGIWRDSWFPVLMDLPVNSTIAYMGIIDRDLDVLETFGWKIIKETSNKRLVIKNLQF
jgi:hypothetical protein